VIVILRVARHSYCLRPAFCHERQPWTSGRPAKGERKMISARAKEALMAAKARGMKVGGFRGVLPTAEHHRMAAQAKKAAAAARAADLASLIRDIKEAGATSLCGIARELNAGEVPAARGGAGSRKRRKIFPLERYTGHTRLRSALPHLSMTRSQRTRGQRRRGTRRATMWTTGQAGQSGTLSRVVPLYPGRAEYPGAGHQGSPVTRKFPTFLRSPSRQG